MIAIVGCSGGRVKGRNNRSNNPHFRAECTSEGRIIRITPHILQVKFKFRLRILAS